MTASRPNSHDDLFARGIAQFNRGEFFASHETWEEIWLAALEPDKTFLQGIIQVAAALHHYTRGNLAGAESLLRVGLKKLEQFPADYRQIQLKPLREASRHWIVALEQGAASGAEPFPQIVLAVTGGSSKERRSEK
jgi:predicted metal-dependent hydrolase